MDDSKLRLLIWKRRNRKLVNDMEKYIDRYRQKICSKCTTEQQKKRLCTKFPNGHYCDHMINARSRVYGKKVDMEIQLKMDIIRNLKEKTVEFPYSS